MPLTCECCGGGPCFNCNDSGANLPARLLVADVGIYTCGYPPNEFQLQGGVSLRQLGVNGCRWQFLYCSPDCAASSRFELQILFDIAKIMPSTMDYQLWISFRTVPNPGNPAQQVIYKKQTTNLCLDDLTNGITLNKVVQSFPPGPCSPGPAYIPIFHPPAPDTVFVSAV